MTAPIVFLDTETTGLAYDDEIWEFAAIRREPDGTVTRVHMLVEHDEQLCAELPEPFQSDHLSRWPISELGVTVKSDLVRQAAEILRPANGVKAHVVGAVPNFDTERLQRMFREHDVVWPAHHHLVDVENLAVGYMGAMRDVGRDAGLPYPEPVIQPPWDSDELSRIMGIDTSRFARHTGMGDAEWALAIYDRIVGGAR